MKPVRVMLQVPAALLPRRRGAPWAVADVFAFPGDAASATPRAVGGKRRSRAGAVGAAGGAGAVRDWLATHRLLLAALGLLARRRRRRCRCRSRELWGRGGRPRWTRRVRWRGGRSESGGSGSPAAPPEGSRTCTIPTHGKGNSGPGIDGAALQLTSIGLILQQQYPKRIRTRRELLVGKQRFGRSASKYCCSVGTGKNALGEGRGWKI